MIFFNGKIVNSKVVEVTNKIYEHARKFKKKDGEASQVRNTLICNKALYIAVTFYKILLFKSSCVQFFLKNIIRKGYN